MPRDESEILIATVSASDGSPMIMTPVYGPALRHCRHVSPGGSMRYSLHNTSSFATEVSCR